MEDNASSIRGKTFSDQVQGVTRTPQGMHRQYFAPHFCAHPKDPLEDRHLLVVAGEMSRAGIQPHLANEPGFWKVTLEHGKLARSLADQLGVKSKGSANARSA